MICGSAPPRGRVAGGAHARPSKTTSSPVRLLLSRNNRNHAASVAGTEPGHGFRGSVQSYCRDIGSGNARQDRDGPEYLVVDIDVGVGSRSSSVEARLSAIAEE